MRKRLRKKLGRFTKKDLRTWARRYAPSPFDFEFDRDGYVGISYDLGFETAVTISLFTVSSKGDLEWQSNLATW